MSERIAGMDGGAMYAGGVMGHGGGKRRFSLDAGMAPALWQFPKYD